MATRDFCNDSHNNLATNLAVNLATVYNVARLFISRQSDGDREMIEELLKHGEGLSVEFKRCGSMPERDVFETVCSFANRQGGHILLGVLDDGTVEGVNENALISIERNIVNVASNPDIFNLAPGLEIEHAVIDGRYVIDVWVPMGPSVYRYKGVVYDRIADVDVRLRGDEQISALYIRKQNLYTEQRVYPYVTEDDLDMGVLVRARETIRANRPTHPWVNLSDDEFLKAARLKTKDFQTGEEGFNLACVMLMGRDETIAGVCPVHRTDAIVRRLNANRYDDRLTVTTNLVDSYQLLCDFCRKWLPDVFALEGDFRVDARDVIVRELVVNTLVHREYASPFISQLIIERDCIKTKNASRCLYAGPISPDNLSPTPKNPIIAGFFTQLGLAEELGSGTRNLYRCSELYTGKEPSLTDGDFFEASVPVPDVLAAETMMEKNQESASSTLSVVEEAARSLLAESESVTAGDVAKFSGLNQRTVRRYLAELADRGVLRMDRRGRSTVYRLGN